MHKEYPKDTICQQLREIYNLESDPEIKLKLRICVSMAKAMDRKLKEYKPGWDKGFWDEHN